MLKHDAIVILGPTAGGKTYLACRIAKNLHGVVLSADSRQVYRRLNIGTGKDLSEYVVDGQPVPYKLIDVADPETQFMVTDYESALKQEIKNAKHAGLLPVICGGTGMYLDLLRKNVSFKGVETDDNLRRELANLSKPQLLQRLRTYPESATSHVDTSSIKRLVRGIEVAEAIVNHGFKPVFAKPPLENPYYIGIRLTAEERRKNIVKRLHERLDAGMVKEAEWLIASGMTHQRMQHLGLEYKYLSYYLLGDVSYKEMVSLLETAIVQYSKRQMTWFRKMEREGVIIHWTHPSTFQETIKEVSALQFRR